MRKETDTYGKQPRENPKHMTKIGGQALIEGVMMKGADTGAMACRLPNGEIDVETWAENNGKICRGTGSVLLCGAASTSFCP